MSSKQFIEEISAKFNEVSAKLSELVAKTPAEDLEKNIKAVLSSAFGRLDLVTRDEFEVERALLLKAQERLAALEEKVAKLEV